MKFFRIFLFLTGIILFGANEANAAVFYSQNNGNPANLEGWNTNRNGGGANPTEFSAGDNFVIQHFHTPATENNWQISGAGISAQNSTDSGNNMNILFALCVPMTASAFAGGRVVTRTGRGIPNTILTLTNLTRGDVVVRRTNFSGYFRFYDLEVGDTFLIQARHKFYRFSGSATFFLVGDKDDIILESEKMNVEKIFSLSDNNQIVTLFFAKYLSEMNCNF